jgi:hypothetical protein
MSSFSPVDAIVKKKGVALAGQLFIFFLNEFQQLAK